MKKIFAAAAAFVLLLSMFAGCASENGESVEKMDSEQIVETEPEVKLDPSPALDMDKIAKHEKISLWGDGDIPYQNDESDLQATIQAYLVDGCDSCVVIFPGGGYFQLSEDSEGNDIARAYNEEGLSAFVACYRYKPYEGDAILADGQRAVQFVRHYAKELGIDENKIAVCGFSAGGHLSMLVAEHPCGENILGDEIGACSSLPNACILGYPVVTLEDGTYVTMPEVFLGSEQENAELLAEYSYQTNLEMMPPSFIFYSLKDTTVDFEKNSVALNDALTKLGKKVVCVAYEDGAHGVGLGEQFGQYAGWLASSAGFLKELGF